MPQHAFGRQDGGAHGISAAAPDVGFTRLRQHLVPAHVVGVRPGVDDVTNGLRRDALDCVDDGCGTGGRPRVDDHRAVLAHLDADAAASTGEQEEVGTDLEDLETARRRRASGLGAQRHGRDMRGEPRRGTRNQNRGEPRPAIPTCPS